jgi:hypothetical protein
VLRVVPSHSATFTTTLLQPPALPARQRPARPHGGREREAPFPFHEYGKIPGALCFAENVHPQGRKEAVDRQRGFTPSPSRSCTAASLQVIQRSNKRLYHLSFAAQWVALVGLDWCQTLLPCVTLWLALAALIDHSPADKTISALG